MNLVHRYSEIVLCRNHPQRPSTSSMEATRPQREQTVRDLRHQSQRKHPDAETIELDATNADHYASTKRCPSLLSSEQSIVIVSNLQNADDKLGETMVAYRKQAVNNPTETSIVICQHEGGDQRQTTHRPTHQSRSRQRNRCRPQKPKRNQLHHTMLRTTQPTHRTHGRTATRSRARRQNRRTRSHGKPTLFRLRRQSHNIERVNQYLTANPGQTASRAWRPRTFRTLSRRHHRHARLRSNKVPRQSHSSERSPETTHTMACGSRTLRHHQRGGSENQFMGAETPPDSFRMGHPTA